MRLRTLALVFTLAIAAAAQDRPRGQAAGDYQSLLALHQDFVKVRQVPVVDGVPDYSPASVEARRQRLAGFRQRLSAIQPAAWPVSQKVDFLLVRADLNGLDFEQRIVRPWERDPGLYVDAIERAPYADVPIAADRLAAFRTDLRAVPRIVEQARRNLTRASGELAGIAIRHLERSDGINQGEPRRAVPPEGVIGWYRGLIERLPTHHPELIPDAKQALAAAEALGDWLKQQQPSMKEPAFVALENYNWYLKNVRLMPFTADDVREMGRREEHRARTFLAIEEQNNRGLPSIEPAKSAEEHERRVREAERHIRQHIRQYDLLTIPEDTPPEFETDAFWIVRPGGKRHFWEELTYRDPRNNHIHASIPGHLFDGFIQRKNPNPIRRAYRDGARGEGWGFYLEEMFVQAGLLDGLPHAAELFYIAQLKRAIRIPCELRMQTGEFTLQQAIDHMVREVPLMEPDLARYDLSIYLRRPTYGMNYLMGKIQIEQLLSDRVRQLGDKFHLGRFHDEFLRAGSIPISLIRWEMTRLDDEVKDIWARATEP
jgi:hypothetical protein